MNYILHSRSLQVAHLVTKRSEILQAYLQQGIPCRAELPMSPGEYRLLLAVALQAYRIHRYDEIPLKLAGK